uniref:Putative integrase n=1 Tax=Zamilon virus TaxID=1411887 RepID=A0A2P1EHI9_9VIRU|nr:putative integrase [Zamilon virus]
MAQTFGLIKIILCNNITMAKLYKLELDDLLNEDLNEAVKIKKGFDRNINFMKIKKKLLRALKVNCAIVNDKEESDYNKRISTTRIIYIIIALLQLRNCSRISEAVAAIKKFSVKKNLNERVLVKIAKSEKRIVDRKTKEVYETKPRYREMIFPLAWVDKKLFKKIIKDDQWAKFNNNKEPRKRVLDYLLNNFDCNTHSLRYAGINFMLNEKKVPMNIIAKFVGHVNTEQLVTYTQHQALDDVFAMDV